MKKTAMLAVRHLAVASMALTGLAACSGGSRKGSDAPTSAPAALRMGFFGALSGPDEAIGIDIEQGERLAVTLYDRSSPQFPVAIDYFDSKGDPSQAANGATTLIRDHDLAVIGPAFATESAAADPVFEQANVPDITASATNLDLAQNGWKFFHRVVADDGAQGRGDADFLVRQQGASSVAVVDDGSAYGSGLALQVAAQVRTDGGSVDVADHIDPSRTDYGPTVRQLVAARPAAVFFGGYYDAAGRLVRQLRSAGYKGVFMSGAGSDDTRFVTAAGGAADGAYVSCPCVDPSQDHSAASFVRAYKSMYHVSPGVYAAEAYDATNFVLAAIAAGDTTPVAVNDYLGSHSYEGVTKTIRFLPDGNVAGGTVYVYKVEGGKITEVGTTS